MHARTWFGLIATWAALVFTAAAGGCQGTTAGITAAPVDPAPAGDVSRSDEAPCDAAQPSHFRALVPFQPASHRDCVARA